MRRFAFFLFLSSLALAGEQVTVQVLATTDMHGYLLPYDYLTGRGAVRGLAKVATLIRAERRRNPNTVLLDCGDTIQGSPLETFHQAHALEPGARPDPMMLAMNALGYDAMTLGNHEFNYGLPNLNRARRAARFPWLSANTIARSGANVRPFDPYLIKTVAGVKVAILGITTPAIPSWEKKENYEGYSWVGGYESALRALESLRNKEHPDLVILAVHAGIERDPATGKPRNITLPGEDMVYRIATEIHGVDAVVFGHSHQVLDATPLGGTLIIQPKNWAGSLAQIEFTLERESSGKPWRVASRAGRILPVTRETPTDPEIETIAKPYHEAAEAWLNTPVTDSPVALDGARARFEDTALIDAIQQVQVHYAQAEVSFASAFNPRARVPKGPVTIRQIAALYIYDNELFAVEGNGRMVREALENAARFFKSCPDPACSSGPLLNREFMSFNFDMAQGVTYDIDLTQPEGSRIRNLRFRGEPLEDARPLRIAVNSYRAGGSGGYGMLRDAKVVWRSYRDIRDLMIDFYSSHPLPVKPDGNWKIVPESALAVLAPEVGADATRNAGK